MNEFRRLAKNAYVFLQPNMVWYNTAGVIIGDSYAVVIDSLTNAAMARELQRHICDTTDKPIRYLINTHEHADHVYTNHLFPEATSIIAHKGREKTVSNYEERERHNVFFARLFPGVDFTGGRYTVQDMAFSGRLSFFQGDLEIRVIELGAGHSESDTIVYLPKEKIVYCGDLFLNGWLPMPSEGHVADTINNYRALEALRAEIYVAGHGEPGDFAMLQSQRQQLEELYALSLDCFNRGMDYDSARKFCSKETGISVDYIRMIVLSSYCEFLRKTPDSQEPESQNHLLMLRAFSDEMKRRNEEEHPLDPGFQRGGKSAGTGVGAAGDG